MSASQTKSTSIDISEYATYFNKILPQPEQFRYQVTHDVIREYVYAIPDYNARYLDVEFARRTRWGSVIAPPGYLYAHGNPWWLGMLPGLKDDAGNELTDASAATEEWELYKPVRPGDVILSQASLEGAEIKKSKKLGDCVLVREAVRYTNQHGDLVAKLTSYAFRFKVLPDGNAENGVAHSYPPLKEGQRTRNIPVVHFPGARFSPPRRYDDLLFFEDVVVGTDVPNWETSPLTAFDIRNFNTATMGQFSEPHMASPEWDCFDPGVGPKPFRGTPDIFANGPSRTNLFASMLAKWGGPNCWVTKISFRNVEWALVGFKLIAGARVTAKNMENGRCLVDLEIWCDSELGFRLNAGSAQVELESRDALRRHT